MSFSSAVVQPQISIQPHGSPGVKPAAPPEERDHRLLSISTWLLEGQPRTEVVATAQALWGISRRTAQLYVQQAQRRLAREAIEEDRLFYLRLSQLQRDKVLNLVFRYLQQGLFDPKVLRALTGLVTAVQKLLDSRDQTAAEVHKLLGGIEQPPAMVQTVARPTTAPTEEQRQATAPKGERPADSVPEGFAPVAPAAPPPRPELASKEAARPTGSETKKPLPKAKPIAQRPTAVPPPGSLEHAIWLSLQPEELPAICPDRPKSRPDQEKQPEVPLGTGSP